MGSITYDFLADSVLFDKHEIACNFANTSYATLEKELQEYRKHCVNNFDALSQEATGKASSIKVFSSLESTPIHLLTKSALYVEQFIIDDPMFKHTRNHSQFSQTATKMLGFTGKPFQKNQLASDCRYLKQITPMVAANYVKILPISYRFEKDDAVINFPNTSATSSIPAAIVDLIRNGLCIDSLERDARGWMVTDTFRPSRGICIRKKDSSDTKAHIYHLFDTQTEIIDEENHLVKFVQTLPDTPPTAEMFEHWVQQSLSSSIVDHFDKIQMDAIVANQYDATYLTDSLLNQQVLAENLESHESIPAFVSNTLLNFNLPYLENVSVEKIMEIRQHEEDVFTNFRIELEKNLKELRLLTDTTTIQLKVDNIMHDFAVVQNKKISTKMDSIRRNSILDGAILAAGLAAFIHTGGLSLIASIAAIAKGFKDYSSYRDQVKENPALLFWKAQTKQQ